MLGKWLDVWQNVYFDADDVDGGSTSIDSESSESETSPDKPDNGSRTFTEEDLGKYAAKAQRKGKDIGKRELLAEFAEFGIEDEDGLKAALAEFGKIKKAQMTEAERIAAEKTEIEAVLEKERAERAKLEAAVQQQALDAAIKEALRDANARKLDKAFRLFTHADATYTKELLHDDGSVNEDELKKQIEQFRKDDPDEFASTAPGIPSNKNGRAPTPELKKDDIIRRKVRL